MQNKKIAILQSNYIPWKGYFDIIDSVDEFIFFDSMSYTIRDWRNRNQIKTENGLKWISIPINCKNYRQNNLKICEAAISNNDWALSHWSFIKQTYSKAMYFKKYEKTFFDLYNECINEKFLCNVNYKFIFTINKILGIKTKLSFDKDYGIIEGKTERLIDLIKKAGGSEYVSGPSAKNYINEDLFKENGIKLTWMDYSKYREYKQMYHPFEHCVSILDLIFNEGDDAIKYIREKK